MQHKEEPTTTDRSVLKQVREYITRDAQWCEAEVAGERKGPFLSTGNLKLRNESCNILKAVNDENLGGHFSLEYKRGHHGTLSY